MWYAGVKENTIGLVSDYVTTKTRGKVVKHHGKSTRAVGKIVPPPKKISSCPKSLEPMNMLG